MYTYKIAAWNANGLTKHQKEVEIFLNTHNIDILLVSETHFTERNYLRIPNYVVYHTKHPDGRAHAGTAVILKKNIKHHELPKYELEHIQATSVCIEDWNGPITISAIYCPPRHNINKRQYKDYFDTLGKRFLAGGDYNAKHQMWGSRIINPKGRELYKLIRESQLEAISTGNPTYWPTDNRKIPDVIDFFVARGISPNYIDVRSCLELSSDHTPIIAHISTRIITYKGQAKLHSKKTDWCYFKDLLNNTLKLNVPLKTEYDITKAVEHFNRVIQNAAWQSTPKEKQQTKQPDYPIEIRNKITEKRRLRRVWHRTRHPDDKHKFNEAARKLKDAIKAIKRRHVPGIC